MALDEWPTHPELIKLQQELLAGNKPAVCKTCIKQEQIYGTSLRTNSNRDYNNQIFTDTNIDFIDFRSVNICNFKCRTCEPFFSNGIAADVKRSEFLHCNF